MSQKLEDVRVCVVDRVDADTNVKMVELISKVQISGVVGVVKVGRVVQVVKLALGVAARKNARV